MKSIQQILIEQKPVYEAACEGKDIQERVMFPQQGNWYVADPCRANFGNYAYELRIKPRIKPEPRTVTIYVATWDGGAAIDAKEYLGARHGHNKDFRIDEITRTFEAEE